MIKSLCADSCCDGGEDAQKISAQPCGCDSGAGWVCAVHTIATTDIDMMGSNPDSVTPPPPYPLDMLLDKNEKFFYQECSRLTNPEQDHRSPSETKSVMSRSAVDDAFDLVNGDRQATYGRPRDAYIQMAKVWSGMIGHKLKNDLTPEDVVLLLASMKLRRECLKHNRDNIVDGHGYLLVLSHVRDDHGE